MTSSTFRFLDPEILRSLPNIEIVARFLVEGLYASRHRSPFYGYSVEFKDYREYAPGDAPKLIDWKAYARTERHFVKRFEMESNMNVVCLLDISGSMDYQPIDPRRLKKLEYGNYLAASLCHLIIKQQDAAGLITFKDDIVDFLPPRQGQRHLLSLLSRLEDLQAESVTDLSNVLKKVAQRLRRRGIFVLISDCHGDVEQTIDGIRHLIVQGHEVVLFHLLYHDEIEFPYEDLSNFRDIETDQEVMLDPIRQRQDYLNRLNQFCTEIRNGSTGSGADYRLVNTSDPIEVVLRDYLIFRRQR